VRDFVAPSWSSNDCMFTCRVPFFAATDQLLRKIIDDAELLRRVSPSPPLFEFSQWAEFTDAATGDVFWLQFQTWRCLHELRISALSSACFKPVPRYQAVSLVSPCECQPFWLPLQFWLRPGSAFSVCYDAGTAPIGLPCTRSLRIPSLRAYGFYADWWPCLLILPARVQVCGCTPHFRPCSFGSFAETSLVLAFQARIVRLLSVHAFCGLRRLFRLPANLGPLFKGDRHFSSVL